MRSRQKKYIMHQKQRHFVATPFALGADKHGGTGYWLIR